MIYDLRSYTNDEEEDLQIIRWKTEKSVEKGVCDKLLTLIDFKSETLRIPNGVKTIASHCFYSNEDDIFDVDATKLVIPASVEKIEDNAFAFTQFEHIQVAADCPACKRVGNALYSRNGKRLICIFGQEEYVVPEGVEELDSFIVQAGFKLTLPASVKRIHFDSEGFYLDSTIKAPANSYAIQFAKKHDMEYEIL